MNKKIGIGFLLIVGISSLGHNLLITKGSSKNDTVAQEKNKRIKQVDLYTSKSQTYQLNITTNGFITPALEIDVSSEVSGRIDSTSANYIVGGTIAKSKVIANIERIKYETAVSEAKYLIAEAERDLAIEEGMSRQAHKSWKDTGSIQSNDLFKRKPHLASAEQKLKYRKSMLDRAVHDLSKTEIRLPFHARITETYANVGQYVQAGEKIAKVIDPFTLKVTLPISDEQAELVEMSIFQDGTSAGVPVKIGFLLAKERFEIDATISKMEPSLDNKTKMYNLIAELKLDGAIISKGGYPIPGMYVEGVIIGKEISGVFRLPRTALSGLNYIYKVENGLAKRTVVDIVKFDNDYVWIRDNESLKELNIIADSTKVVEGDRVAPISKNVAQIESVNRNQ